MPLLNPWLQSSRITMRSTHRLSSGSKKTPRHLTKPGRSAFLLDVSIPKSDLKNVKLVCTTLWTLILPGQETASKPSNKDEIRRQYLMEKYVWKWKQFMRSRSEGLFPRLLKLGHNNWLRQVSSALKNLAVIRCSFHLSNVIWCFPRCCSPQPPKQRDKQPAPSSKH